jgi:hypothetical protein
MNSYTMSPMVHAWCWVCKNQSESYNAFEKQLPDGWRKARRGYAGWVKICPECIQAKRNYQKDHHVPAFVEYKSKNNISYFYYNRICVATIFYDKDYEKPDFPWALLCNYGTRGHVPKWDNIEHYDRYISAKTVLRNLLGISDKDLLVTDEFSGVKI